MKVKLRDLLILHEGMRLEPYVCTAGKWTIGVGYNYEDRGFPVEVLTQILEEGFSEHLAYSLLEDDIDAVIESLRETFMWFPQLDEVRMIAICDMCFNLGIAGLMKFRNMLAAFKVADYDKAAIEATDSRWYSQVGGRAERIVGMIRTGQWPEI